MNFHSDNAAGACEAVMRALHDANAGAAVAYGDDPWTAKAQAALNDLFEREVAAFPVATGTAANALALSVLAPPYGKVYCHRFAHIEEDECGAPEFYSGGAKLGLLDGPDGRIPVEALAETLAAAAIGGVHHAQPAAISLTQATECGTVYELDQVCALAEVAHRYGLAVHMDGARFANAVAALGCTPAELTWKAGIDVLSFGATKNGAWAAEAVVFFDPGTAGDFAYRRKRAGHLLSKMRLISAQLVAYCDEAVWRANAAHANAMARRLGDGLVAQAGARLAHPLQINEVFVALSEKVAQGMLDGGVGFHGWPTSGSDVHRLVCAFNTDPADVDRAIAIAAAAHQAPQ
ncbi:MAG: beta-eliminating lyase-related protein [Alphaproteobacteria bacterium]